MRFGRSSGFFRGLLMGASFVAVARSPVLAQSGGGPGTDAEVATGFVGTVGLGGGGLGLAGEASVGWSGPFGELRLRAFDVTNVDLAISSRPGRHDESWDLALVYGRRVNLGSPYWLRIWGGPAYVRTIGQWEFLECSLACPGTGSAGSVGAAWALMFGRGALSLNLLGDVNENRSFWGITIGWSFGAGH